MPQGGQKKEKEKRKRERKKREREKKEREKKKMWFLPKASPFSHILSKRPDESSAF